VPHSVVEVCCAAEGFGAWRRGASRSEERGIEAGVDLVEALA
jgi:hypothetical protein